MPLKQPKRETAKERAMAYMTSRIRKSYPKFDRHGGYMEACAALAEETGCDAVAAYDEFLDRCRDRLYSGTVEIEDAELAALADVQERFRKAS